MGAKNGSACSVRLIAVDDWQDWRRLRQEALREAPYAFGSSLASWIGEGDTEERWRNRLRDVPVNFVATLDGLDVGMCSLTAIADGKTDLIAMWVAPEARGRGVGRALVGAAVDQARADGATQMFLDVVAENESAVALYSTCGFVDVGFAPGSTPDRQDRRMRLDLLRPTRPRSTAMLARLVIRDGRTGDVETMAWARSEDQREAWRQQLNRASAGEVDFLVAEVGGRTVGKAVLDWTHNADGTPWLWMVSVDPDYRSQGIGAGILAAAEARAQERGHASIEMGVDDDNPRARDLYLRNGYAAVRPLVDEYDVVQPDGVVCHVATPGVVLRKTFTAVCAIVCDLDGVIRAFDSRLQAAVEHRHGLPEGAIAQAAFNPAHLRPAITGAVSDERWRATVAAHIADAFPGVDATSAVTDWSAHQGYVMDEVLSLLDRARSRVPVVLLTNATSRLHEDLDTLDLISHFDAIVSSAAIGAAKPDRKAYAATASTVQGLLGTVDPAGLLLIDDSEANVAAAAACGWHACLFTSPDKLEATFLRLGLVDP